MRWRPRVAQMHLQAGRKEAGLGECHSGYTLIRVK